MKYEHWQIPAAPEDAIKTLMDAGYPYLVSSVLAARGVTTSEQAAEALEREKTLAHTERPERRYCHEEILIKHLTIFNPPERLVYNIPSNNQIRN